jgi:hypothetical protein
VQNWRIQSEGLAAVVESALSSMVAVVYIEKDPGIRYDFAEQSRQYAVPSHLGYIHRAHGHVR